MTRNERRQNVTFDLRRLTTQGAHEFVGWMLAVAKHRPTVLAELESFVQSQRAYDKERPEDQRCFR